MALNIGKLKADRVKLLADATALAAPYSEAESYPPDLIEKVNALLGKADDLDVQIKTFDRLHGMTSEDNAEQEISPAAASWRQAGPSEGNIPVDEKSWREEKNYRGIPVRYKVPLAVERAGKDYVHSFEAYLRKGFSNLGAMDRKNLTETVDNSGGFYTPSEFLAMLIKRTPTGAHVRSLASVMNTSRDLVKIPRINYSTDDKYSSGVRFTWTGETPATSTTHRVTDQISGEITIPIHTAMASQLLNVQLLEDAAFDVWQMSADEFGTAFDLGEDDVFLTGNGVSKPMGILGQMTNTAESPTIVKSGTSSVLTTGGDAHEGVRLNNIYYNLPAQYRANARWMMNSQTMLLAENLVDLQDRPILHTLTNGSMQDGEINTIKGRPVVIDEFLADPGASSNSIIFGDFKGYLIFDRVGMSIKRYDELYAETNFVLMLARKRMGAYLWKPFMTRVLQLGA